MKKIYLDYNIIIYMKNNNNLDSEKIADLVKILKSNDYSFFFSPGHLEEIAVSSLRDGTNPDIIDKDLDFLTKLCGKNSIMPKSMDKPAVIGEETPRKCYERVIKNYEQNEGAERQQYEFLKICHTLNKDGPLKMNNIDETKIVNQILTPALYNQLLQNLETWVSKNEIKYMLEYPNKCKENFSSTFKRREISIEALCNLLEFFGFHREKQKKSRSRFFDVAHIIYASYSDIFVTNDKKLEKKAKAIYSFLDIKTNVLTLEEFLSYNFQKHYSI